MTIKTTDYLIIGAGIMGLSIARALKKREPKARITVLEKEDQIGLHASGRNSGVLHSGIYYSQNSLKAKVCAEGAKQLSDYCETYKLPLHRVGKIIVPTTETDTQQLNLLYERAAHNKARVELIDEDKLHTLEPMVRSATGTALYCPDTAVINSKQILQHIQKNLEDMEVTFNFKSRLLSVNPNDQIIQTGNQIISYGHLFNTAGLYADAIATSFGIKNKYTILPFKGIYYRLDPTANIKLNHLIYPVPDLNVPFLGVHFTKTIEGGIIVGPTAVPAFGRENYRRLEGVTVKEAFNIVKNLGHLYIKNTQGFRNFAHAEASRFMKSKFAIAAKALVPALKAEHLLPSTKVGIRAQLLDLEKEELVMDFLVETDKNATHVLNAVSPAFTSAFSFAELILDRLI